MYDVIVIGAGVIGSLIARELARYEVDVLLLDKENDVGNGSSMANSAIVHSGYDPVPGTKKAYFNVRGNALYEQMCDELDVSLGKIGSLTVATEDEQLPILKELAQRAKENGVQVELLDRQATLDIEPSLVDAVKGSLLAKSAMIVNPFTLVAHAVENALDNGVSLKLGQKVINIVEKDGAFDVITEKTTFSAKIVINAAGLYGDKIAKLLEPDLPLDIMPRKGEYYVLDHFGRYLVNHVIFPLPSAKGKGILVSPTTSNNFIVGPSSEPVDSLDDLSTDKLTLDSVKQGALSLVKTIPFNETIRVFSGLRATPSTHDFYIETKKDNKHFINVIGIESPGLASSPAIAKYVMQEMVGKVISLKEKTNFNPCVKKRVVIKTLPDEVANKLIKERPEYGQMICNCEKVSVGELLDELNRNNPPRTIKAIKKRLRIGFGKCQGGFCQPKIVKFLSEYYGVKMTDVLYDKDGSNILLEETKKEAKE